MIARFNILLFLFVSVFFVSAYATHNRAGEITYESLGGLQYKATIITYTKTSSTAADRPVLDSVHWGDGTMDSFSRSSKVDLPNDVSRNIYFHNHTYSASGQYLIHFEDPNRNEGVINVPNSVNVPFFVSTLLIINPFQGANNSPVLLQPPIDHGCKSVPYIHNANAYDVDGDSISYALTVCRGAGGNFIPGYTLPAATNNFTLNPVTGDLVWDSPDSVGEYNVAFNVIEWRNGIVIGTVTRDMQISIENCTDSNQTPQITPLPDTCVLAGDTIRVNVIAIDPDNHKIALTATGGPFEVTNKATFLTSPATPFVNDTVTGVFNWITNCGNIRLQPYRVEFKAQDNDTIVNLVDLKGFFIRVIAPPPQNLTATSAGNGINLNWSPSPCNNATGYRIYRRGGLFTGVIPCPCDNGAPSYTGFVLIRSTLGNASTSFTDNNNGNGLTIGVEYCYIVTSIFADGSESCASGQTCASLKKDLPVLTNASVNFTDAMFGSMYIAWSKPTQLDTIQFPPPYQYRLYHSPDFIGSAFTFLTTKPGLDDTTYVDTLLNTFTLPYSYRVDLYYDTVPKLKGSSTIASSVFLSITPTDNQLNLSWQANVPWSNSRYDIFKFNPFTLQFDSIASVTQTTYSDTGLQNGVSYCYYVRSVGSYLAVSGFVDPIINLSQRECAVPVDNVPPCAPLLQVLPNCANVSNGLVWTLDPGSCDDDVDHFEIYYSPVRNGNFELIQTISNGSVLTFNHTSLSSITGCYKVIAVDSAGNKSSDSLAACVDTCSQYVLPSVFTPNGDGLNDIFHPCDSATSVSLQIICPPYRNVKDVSISIFNRWGNIEFETTDRNINWDGKNQDSHVECSDGVYYYVCKVNFFTLDGTETRVLTGFVHLVRGK